MRAYLDHASTSPLRPEAAAAIRAWIDEHLDADPSRQYGEGRAVRDAVEHAREQVAALAGARPREVVFTSGATESINTAASAFARSGVRGTQVLPAVEHAAVRLAAANAGPVRVVAVGATGRVDLDDLTRAFAEGPVSLVHCQMANHEVGTVQPVSEVIAAAHARGVPVHLDASMALGVLPVDFAALGAELVSLSAHKVGGPPGVGALLVRRGMRLEPLLCGGDQERARRAGFENVPGILGFGAVAETLAHPGALSRARAMAASLTLGLRRAALAVEGVVEFGDADERTGTICCFGVQDVEAEAIVLGLDQAGVAVHSGSACASEGFEPSPVLAAMGVDAQRSLRLSVGWSTTDADVEMFASAFPGVVARLRALAASA